METRHWVACIGIGLVLLAGCAGVERPATSPAPSTTTAPSDTTTHQMNWTVTVIEVIDGDTFSVRFANGSTTTIRLLGVDAPETHATPSPAEFEGVPATAAGREWLTSWGVNATTYAQQTLSGKQIRIAVDATADRRGYYGRLLVYAYHNGTLFNSQLLARGYARLYETDFTKRATFTAVESAAQTADRGVWGYDSSPTGTTPPDDTASGLSVTSVHANAAGDDWGNLNDEYVILTNTGTTTRDLSGWTIRDDDGHVTQFPPDTTLAPGGTLTVYTGRGPSTEDSVYLGYERPIWNNNGDVLTIEAANGTRIIRHRYP